MCRNVIFPSDLYSYKTKSDFKNVIGVDISEFAKNADLVSLKFNVEELDIGKLKIVPVDLIKLCNVITNYVVRKTENNKVVTKVEVIDTRGFALKLNITLTNQWPL